MKLLLIFLSAVSSVALADSPKDVCNNALKTYFEKCQSREKVESGYKFSDCGLPKYESISIQYLNVAAEGAIPPHKECREAFTPPPMVDEYGRKSRLSSDLTITSSLGSTVVLADSQINETITGADGSILASTTERGGTRHYTFNGKTIEAPDYEAIQAFKAGKPFSSENVVHAKQDALQNFGDEPANGVLDAPPATESSQGSYGGPGFY